MLLRGPWRRSHQSRTSGNDFLNRYVFSRWRNRVSEGDDWISDGRVFHRIDAATVNDRRRCQPYMYVLPMPTKLNKLSTPRTLTSTLGPRAFSVSGLASWNALPPRLRNPYLFLEWFRQRLKTALCSVDWLICYSLPANLRLCGLSYGQFGRLLKTFLFGQWGHGPRKLF